MARTTTWLAWFRTSPPPDKSVAFFSKSLGSEHQHVREDSILHQHIREDSIPSYCIAGFWVDAGVARKYIPIAAPTAIPEPCQACLKGANDEGPWTAVLETIPLSLFAISGLESREGLIRLPLIAMVLLTK